MILNAEGQSKTPSLVHFDDDETLVGESVENLLQDVSTDAARREDVFRRTVTSIKRNLLSPPRIALPGGRYVRPVDVAAAILAKIKHDAEEGHFHETVSHAVITCPAEFNVLQRQKIEEAGRMAGFTEVAILEEPVAGALAYARAGLDVGEHVLVYDLGGGTFDLAVLDSEDESFHVAMEPKGMERCGGEDFDLALYHHCDEVAREKLGRPISLTGAVDLSFLRACRRRKESLTFQERGRFNHYLSSTNGPVHFEHEVERRTFEALISDYIEITARLTKGILDRAESAGHEVDTVVLVGGSVRVPLVVHTLEETLPVSPLGFDKRDVAVALGAAHYADTLWGNNISNGRRRVSEETGPAWVESYEAALKELPNGRLNRSEANRLRALAGESGASLKEAERVEVRLLGSSLEDMLHLEYRRAVEMVWTNNNLNEREVEWMNSVARELGLSQTEAAGIEKDVTGNRKELFLRRRKVGRADRTGFVVSGTLSGHTGAVSAAAFSPDGNFIVSGGSDHDLRGWNAHSGESVGALPGHTGQVNAIAFSPDGRFVVSGGSDRSVRLWSLPHGEPSGILQHPGWVLTVAVSPGNGLIASGCTDTKIRLWNRDAEVEERAINGHSNWVTTVTFSADGQTLASGSSDETVRLWNLETLETIRVLKHPGRVFSVVADPGFLRLFSGCEDGSLRIWDTRNGEMTRVIAAHSGAVLSVALSLDGRLLLSGGEDGKVRVWNPKTGVQLDVLPGSGSGVRTVAARPDGESFASGGEGIVSVWKRPSASGEIRSTRSTRSFRPGSPRAAVPPPDLPS